MLFFSLKAKIKKSIEIDVIGRPFQKLRISKTLFCCCLRIRSQYKAFLTVIFLLFDEKKKSVSLDCNENHVARPLKDLIDGFNFFFVTLGLSWINVTFNYF